MCQHVGWKYKPIIDKLEAARKDKAARYYKKQAGYRAAWADARAKAVAKMSPANVAILKKFGVIKA
jgi:hypothetical protein